MHEQPRWRFLGQGVALLAAKAYIGGAVLAAGIGVLALILSGGDNDAGVVSIGAGVMVIAGGLAAVVWAGVHSAERGEPYGAALICVPTAALAIWPLVAGYVWQIFAAVLVLSIIPALTAPLLGPHEPGRTSPLS